MSLKLFYMYVLYVHSIKNDECAESAEKFGTMLQRLQLVALMVEGKHSKQPSIGSMK